MYLHNFIRKSNLLEKQPPVENGKETRGLTPRANFSDEMGDVRVDSRSRHDIGALVAPKQSKKP